MWLNFFKSIFCWLVGYYWSHNKCLINSIILFQFLISILNSSTYLFNLFILNLIIFFLFYYNLFISFILFMHISSFNIFNIICKCLLSCFIISSPYIRSVMKPYGIILILNKVALHFDYFVKVYFLYIITHFINLFQTIFFLIIFY